MEKVADILARRFGEAAILYDKFHEAELARARLGRYLPKQYHDDSDLVVVVVCRDYATKEWCGLEWDAIFDLLKKRREDEVMLCRFDYATVEGLFSDAGFVDLDRKTPEQAANLIFERLQLNEGKSKDYDNGHDGDEEKVCKRHWLAMTAVVLTAIVLPLAVFVPTILETRRSPEGRVKLPPPALPDRRYFPYAGDTLRANVQPLGNGTELRDTGGTSLLITRRPGTEPFYGLTLTVQPGGNDSWKRYWAAEGEVEVEFSPSRNNQVLILKAEFIGGEDVPSWIYGEATLERPPTLPSGTAGPVVCRVAVRDLLQRDPNRYEFRVNRLTLEEKLQKEPVDRASFELHGVVLRPKPPP